MELIVLADLHVHSNCSDDGVSSMLDMARSAVERGIDYLCFTDHCDLEHYTTGKYDPDCFNWEGLTEAFNEAVSAFGDKITLRLGLELGAAAHESFRAKEILKASKPDFVIGSVHNFTRKPDFCLYGADAFDSTGKCREILSQYIQEHFELIQLTDFDVIGHIGYPLRYMRKVGMDIDLNEFTGELELLFGLLADGRKGIEVNTSGLRNGFGTFLPMPEILKLYRNSGGELITIGSDAHDTQSVGSGIREAQKLLQELGYKYFAIFKDRKPEYIKL